MVVPLPDPRRWRHEFAGAKADVSGSATRWPGADYDLGHGDVVIAAITSLHQHLQSLGDDRRRPGRAKARERGLTVKPWVKTSLAPGSQVVTEYLEAARPAERSRQTRLRSGRLWLHHLYRQFRAAARADLRGDRRRRARRRLRCFRATATSKAGSTRTPGSTIWPRRRWWSPMRWPAIFTIDLIKSRSARTRRSQPVFLKDIWPSSTRKSSDRIWCEVLRSPKMFRELRQRVRGRCGAVAQDQGRGRPDLWLEQEVDLCPLPALLRGHDGPSRAASATSRRGCSPCSARFDHHRPHLAGRLDPRTARRASI